MKTKTAQTVFFRVAVVPFLFVLFVLVLGGYAIYSFNFERILDGFVKPHVITVTSEKALASGSWLETFRKDLFNLSKSVALKEFSVLPAYDKTPQAGGTGTQRTVGLRERRALEARERARLEAAMKLSSALKEKAAAGGYKLLAVLSPEGKVLAASREESIGGQWGEKAFFRAKDSALKAPAALGVVAEGVSSYGVEFLAPIHGAPDNLTGYIYGLSDAGELAGILRPSRPVFRTERMELIGADGEVVLTRDGLPKDKRKYNLSGRTSGEGVGHRDRVFYYFVRLGGSPFRLISLVDSDEVTRPLMLPVFAYGVCSILIIAVLLLQGAALSRLVVKPLKDLLSAVKSIRMGNMDIEVNKGGIGELAELSGCLDELRSEIQDRELLLRQGVKVEVKASAASGISVEMLSRELTGDLEALEAELVGSDGASQDDNAAGRRLRKRAAAMRDLLSGVLDLEALRAGRSAMLVEEFMLGDILEALRAEALLAIGMKEIELIIDCEATLASRPLYADGKRVRSIISGLMSVAVGSTEEGTITVTAAEERRDEAEYLELSVSDTGSGLSGDRPGLLTLAIAKEMTALLGGEMEAQVIEGKGSTYTAVIPVKSAAY